MNKSFVKKLVKAKLLEYEAIKEILGDKMPESLKEMAKELEKDVMDIAKEIIWEKMSEGNAEQTTTNNKENTNSKAKVNKVDIQFGEE
ncbi:MAG: hypothetical protein J6F30_11835 [Cellulosilyticum sp.]|nr:hypothetical protein [Cellulosilyticum sp.]